MTDDPPQWGHVVDRLVDLERRVATLEAQRFPQETGSEPTAARPGVRDPERFWALTGLQERIGPGSAVLFTGSVNLPGDRSYVWQQGIDAAELLKANWDQAAGPLGALGHPIRLKLLQEILNGASTTAEIGATEGVGTTGQLYHHLRELVAGGWLTTAARGRYAIPAGRVVPLLVTISATHG